MKISLLHPSRGRPEKSFKNAMHWLLLSRGDVEIIISLDSDDKELNKYIKLYDGSVFKARQKIIINDNKSVVEATNKAAELSTGDILIYLSDDFDCFFDWDKKVIKEFEYANYPLLIKVDDCLQKFLVPVLTIPMMNRQLYEKLGYFWHPEYKSMFVDCDLYETVSRMDAIKLCDYLKFEHKHVSVGKAENDETYRRSEANWSQGQALFNKRKTLGFPL